MMSASEVAAILCAAVGAAVLAGWFFDAHAHKASLIRELEQLGLKPLWEHDAVGSPEWFGAVGGVEVRVYAQTLPDRPGATETTLVCRIPGETAFKLSRPPQGAAPPYRSTGDDAFDRLLMVHGDEAAALAVLDAPLRQSLCELRRWESTAHVGFLVSDGWVRMGRSGGLLQEALAPWIKSAVSFAQALKAPSDIEGALARNVEVEPNPSAGALYLEALARRFPGRPATQRQLERSLDSPVAMKRVVAARYLKTSAAQQVLLSVACSCAWEDSARASALVELVKQGPGLELGSVVAEALRGASSELRLAAIGAAGTLADPQLLLALEHVGRDCSTEEGLALVAALVRIGPPAEGVLQLLLTHRADEVAARAARGLGRVGSVRSVARLQPLARALRSHGGLTEAARDAIRSIQARHGAAGGGALQLAALEAPRGALAPAADKGALAPARGQVE